MSGGVRPIVIIGGGIAAVTAALAIEKSFGGRVDTPILLITNSDHYHTRRGWYHALSNSSSRPPVRYTQKLRSAGVHVIEESVIGLDADAKQVITSSRRIPYDQVVIASGLVPKSIPPSDDVAMVSAYHNDAAMVAAELDRLLHGHQRLKPVVVVGGGMTGVEVASHLQHLVRRHSPRDGEALSKPYIVLVEGQERLLPTHDPRLGQKAFEWLRRNGVAVHTTTHASWQDEALHLNGEAMSPELVVWAHGLSTPAYLRELKGLRSDHQGRILVESSLQAIDHPGVWAIGDSAAVKDTGNFAGAQAHALHVGRAIPFVHAGKIAPAYYPSEPLWTIHLQPQYGIVAKGNHISEGPHAQWIKDWREYNYRRLAQYQTLRTKGQTHDATPNSGL